MDREEAIEIIRKNMPSDKSLPVYEAIQTLIPELRESEDERIRKALIDALKVSETIGELKFRLPYPTREECIAYLEKQKNLDKMIVVSPEVWDGAINDAYENGKKDSEKQKEQKPEHFELKAGKWYICHRAFCCRADHLTVKEGERFMCEKDGIVKGFVIKEPEKYFKECSAPAPMEDEQKEQKPVVTLGETYHVDTLGTQQVIAGKMPTDKPTEWSDEDEAAWSDLMWCIEQARKSAKDENDMGNIWFAENWVKNRLKSLRPQPKPEWSEEDEKIYQTVFNHFNSYEKYSCSIGVKKEHILSWLKSLRPQPKPEWSEEDRKMIDDIIYCLPKMAMGDIMMLPSVAEEYSNRLKSLRPSWKPGEEQMEAFKDYIEDFQAKAEAAVGGWNNFDVMIQLYEQLKKL